MLYLKVYGGKIGTKKIYAYKRHMLTSGMLITGMQCTG